MKTKENKLKITETFEIRLRSEHWLQINQLAQIHQITYTWVSRLCLFKLLKNWKNYKHKIQQTNIDEKKALKENTEKLHRHILCVYGDEITIRILAANLGLTITQLVRIAIILFAKSICTKMCKKKLVELGIKIVIHVMEFHNKYNKVMFRKEDYWQFRPCFGLRLHFL